MDDWYRHSESEVKGIEFSIVLKPVTHNQREYFKENKSWERSFINKLGVNLITI